jgi:hypothetical protein
MLFPTNIVKTCQKFSGATLQARDMVANMSEVPALLPSLTERLTTSCPEEPHPRSRLSSASCVAVVAATLGGLCGFAVFGAKTDTPAARATAVRPALARTASTDAEALQWISHRLTYLRVRPHWHAAALRVDDAALINDLSEAVSELWVGRLAGNEDAIFIGGSINGDDWRTLRASISPTGVVWRIYRQPSAARADATAAAAAGFERGPSIRYSPDYVAERFTPRRKAQASQRASH